MNSWASKRESSNPGFFHVLRSFAGDFVTKKVQKPWFHWLVIFLDYLFLEYKLTISDSFIFYFVKFKDLIEKKSGFHFPLSSRIIFSWKGIQKIKHFRFVYPLFRQLLRDLVKKKAVFNFHFS